MGCQEIPTLPNSETKIISADEEEQLIQLFIMMANVPYPCIPHYKLFIKNSLIRPNNIAQWPIFEEIETAEVQALGEVAKDSVKYWLVASSRETGATGGALETTASTSTDPPVQTTSSSPEESTSPVSRSKRSVAGGKRAASTSVADASPAKSAKVEEAAEEAMETDAKSGHRHGHHPPLRVKYLL
ncbi:hypothetical protein PoB_001293000 [Plakobranchus ocellatus]|uniref:Uncharacterized protein n=1 Tax=Plakobranchus ocellatus TaxID=259542 RepID=A0AAV3YVF6_9GAST|nr:hypothetical protein PoB_001293000 [Plakobranchus ocellatus]